MEKSEDSAGEVSDKAELSVSLPCLGMVEHHKRLVSQKKEFTFMSNPQGWTQANLASAIEHAHPGELLQVSSQKVFLPLE